MPQRVIKCIFVSHQFTLRRVKTKPVEFSSINRDVNISSKLYLRTEILIQQTNVGYKERESVKTVSRKEFKDSEKNCDKGLNNSYQPLRLRSR